MSFSISDLFGSSANTANSGMSDALKAGANAGLGYLEQQAINLLQSDKQQHEAAVQSSTQNMLNQPSNPNGFGAYLSGLVKNPALQTYGPYVIGGIAIVLVVGYFMGRK